MEIEGGALESGSWEKFIAMEINHPHLSLR